MEELEVKVHKEITEYHEKFYGLTVRQIICILSCAAAVIPTYMYLSPIITADLAGYVVILITLPFAVVGFIKIQGLDAEKIIPYWWRNYVSFSKPLLYKTEKEILAEKEAKKQKKRKPKAEITAMSEVSHSTIEPSVSEEKEVTVPTPVKKAPVSKIEIKKQKKLARKQKKETANQEKLNIKQAKKDSKRKKQQEKIEAKRLYAEELERRKKIKQYRKDMAMIEEYKRKNGFTDSAQHFSSSVDIETLINNDEIIEKLSTALIQKNKKKKRRDDNEETCPSKIENKS